MQTLTQIQANRLKDILEYAKAKIHHPEWHYEAPQLCVTGYHSLSLSTAQQVRDNAKYALEAAERRAQGIDQYESFVKDVEEFLTIIKTLDYATAIDSVVIENTSPLNSAKLGDIFNTPDAFDHLGKRGEVDPRTVTPDPQFL